MTAPSSPRAIAEAVRTRMEAAWARGHTPVAVLDLDHTLVDPSPRTRHILVEYARTHAPDAETATRWVRRAETMPLVFSIRDNFARMGVPPDEISRVAIRFWLRRFFSPLCRLDEPFEDASTLCRVLVRQGVRVVYLTARPADRMAVATVAELVGAGFPFGTADAMLWMKPRSDVRDTAYKQRMASRVAELGTVVLAADDDPSHCNAFRAAFDDAVVVQVGIFEHPEAPPLAGRIERIDRLGRLATHLAS